MNHRIVATLCLPAGLLVGCAESSDRAAWTGAGSSGLGGATASAGSDSTVSGTTGELGQSGNGAGETGLGGSATTMVSGSATVATTALGAGGSAGSTGETTGGAIGGDAGGSAGTSGASGSAGTSGAGGSAGAGGQGSGGTGVTDPGTEGDGRFEIGPPYDSVNLEQRSVPQGAVYDFTMESSDSTIYPGLNGPYTRQVQVYIPGQYQDGVAAPFMVVQDGPGHTGRVRRALDNLIADGGAPPLIAIMVDHGGGNGVGSQRGLEYDTVSDVYANFVEAEVLPAVQENPDIAADYPNLSFTENPEGGAAMGCSSGAAAAFTMAWFRPDRFRRVLSYSGTFTDQQDPQVSSYPNGAWEYHEHLIDEASMKPLRVYLHVGELDLGYDASEEGHQNWTLANERMFQALTRNGYHTRFEFALGTGHCDGSVMDHTIYEALEWLWRGYPLE